VSLAAALLLASAPVRAQDSVTLESVELRPNLQAAGVTAHVTGDDDGDATASLTYRRAAGGGPTWPGHPLVRLDGQRFVGAVLYLDPGTEYVVEVTVQDPDNAAPAVGSASGATRADAPPAPAGGHLWVDAVGGDDAQPGTQAAPLASIGAALEQAQPGDTIHVLPGIYYEALAPPSGGTAEAPLVIRAEGPGAVLSGAQQALAEGGVTWQDEGDGIWSTPFSDACGYLAADDVRLFDYASLTELQQETGKIGVPGALAGGFYVDEANGRLYVRLPDRSPPAGHTLYAAVRERGILLDGLSDVVVQGLEIRHFSQVGIDIRDSQRCWIRGNHLHHLNAGVRLRRSGSHDNVVEDNRLRDTSVWGWPWGSCKGETCEASAVSVTGGAGNVVRRNQIEGFFNGLYTGQWATTDEAIARNTDVWENTLRQIADDGLEPEGACVNQRFVENIIHEVHNAVSLAPIETGPVWILRNVLAGYDAHALKLNNGSTGHMLVYHNTGVPHPDADGAQPLAPTVPFGGLVSRNNLWTANRYVIEYMGDALLGPVDLDYDNLWTHNTDGGSRFVKWLDVRYDNLAQLAADTGLEAHGFQHEPRYEDPAGGDYTLVADSPLVNAGVALAGVNDRFAVDGPDVGAFERGGAWPGPDDGGVPWPDGGAPVTDSGVDPDPDADAEAPTTDAGAPPGSGGDGGCGCRGAPGAPAPWTGLALWGLLWLGSRRWRERWRGRRC